MHFLQFASHTLHFSFCQLQLKILFLTQLFEFLTYFRSAKKQSTKSAERKTSAQPTQHISQIPIATKRPTTVQKHQTTIEDQKVHSSSASSASKASTVTKPPGTARSSKNKPQSHRLTVGRTSSSVQSSRSPSPASVTSRTRSKSTSFRKSRADRLRIPEDEASGHRSRLGSRFSSPVKVEDLAYRPPISPIPILLQNAQFQQKKPRTDTQRTHRDVKAFVILDEVNNNFYHDTSSNKENNLYKEQRWMSSWYSPSYQSFLNINFWKICSKNKKKRSKRLYNIYITFHVGKDSNLR